MKARIIEIFDSVQGEGLYLGEKQIFVRFYGCNLCCHFCDTKLRYFAEYAVEDLLNEIKSFSPDFHSVSFTGGEPLLQKDFLKEALPVMKQEGYTTYLESNGTLFEGLKEVIADIDIVAMDFKLPSSTADFPYWKAHRKFLEVASQKEVFVKMVICNSTKAEDLAQALNILKEVNPAATVILQPNSHDDSFVLDNKMRYYSTLCEENDFASCIIPQMHKTIEVK